MTPPSGPFFSQVRDFASMKTTRTGLSVRPTSRTFSIRCAFPFGCRRFLHCPLFSHPKLVTQEKRSDERSCARFQSGRSPDVSRWKVGRIAQIVLQSSVGAQSLHAPTLSFYAQFFTKRRSFRDRHLLIKPEHQPDADHPVPLNLIVVARMLSQASLRGWTVITTRIISS